jgi:hypothetical protein
MSSPEPDPGAPEVEVGGPMGSVARVPNDGR